MGFFFSKFYSLISARKCKILMVGLDAAGKTTVLTRLKLNETVNTIPTIGFNVDTIEYKNLTMTMWDLGGQDKIRRLWPHYYEGNDALIYVVDSADPERIDESAEELHRLLSDDNLNRIPLLVLANKQDLPGSFSATDICEKLHLDKTAGRDWFVQSAVATTGNGLFEGLDWLARNMKPKKK